MISRLRRVDEMTAVVTGTGCGIGRALARALARREADLVLADINTVALGEVSESLGGGPLSRMSPRRNQSRRWPKSPATPSWCA